MLFVRGVLHSRDEHGPGGPPGPVRRGPRARPGLRLAARTFENFRYNKQIVWPSLQLAVVCTAEAGSIRLFMKASQNFREIHYHFSVPASRQLIQASRGALRTQL